MEIQNANPTVYQQVKERKITPEEEDEEIHDVIDSREIFDILFIPFLLKVCRKFVCFVLISLN